MVALFIPSLFSPVSIFSPFTFAACYSLPGRLKNPATK
jgi:hypothetical protein